MPSLIESVLRRLAIADAVKPLWRAAAAAFGRWRNIADAKRHCAEDLGRRLLTDLPAALNSGAIFLAYQPKLRLRTGQIEAVEALVRWQHDELGPIARDVLIPLIEAHGQIRELTLWVLRRALTDQQTLAGRGYPIDIYINVSAGLLIDSAFVREVCELIDPRLGRIGLEITETVLIENSALALANLKHLSQHGIAISIDDYGSGMSSLAYLRDLPAQELKIDKMFVSGMTTSHRDPLIVRSTIDLAHALELEVVAEGVESPAALALLRVMGCDLAQGFLISPALPVDGLERFLAAHIPDLGSGTGTMTPPPGFWLRTLREPSDVTETAA